MIGAWAAVFLAAALSGAPPPIHDGGVCAGISWVRLAHGESAVAEEGPDFTVYRFNGLGEQWWGVYAGNAAQVTGNGALLFARDGVVVHRAVVDGKFRGYLAEKGRWQNHFFGAVFKDGPGDRTFFDRIDFGAKGQALCAKGR